ncbi:MAG: hypothetical protein AB1540_10645 [Bdellovibrionota bacterium]
MKLKLFIAVATLSLSAAAFAENTQSQGSAGTTSDMNTSANGAMSPDRNMGSTDNTQMGAESRTPAAEDSKKLTDLSPKEVCNRLVQMHSSASSNMQGVDQLVLQEKDRMMNKSWLKQEISQTECSDEKIAGDHAFVLAKSDQRERLIPFVKQNGVWKMDAQAYKTLYRMEQRTPASK